MNNRIASLQPYPFQKLANLFVNVTPPADKTKILPSLGDPKHLPPQFVLNKLADSLDTMARYPVTHGLDECYSEIYFDDQTPPPGLLEVAAAIGATDFSHCIVFHSLSKRSNLPGLRSGFVAGDANILKKYLQYRTYHGAALSVPAQLASIEAWQDETHVIKNRGMYREKFAAVLDILGPSLMVQQPEAGFYLWAETPINDEDFAQQLYANENIVVLPGSYLSRDTEQGNPGENHIRMALVANIEESIDAAERIKHFIATI